MRLACERNRCHYVFVDTSQPWGDILTAYLASRQHTGYWITTAWVCPCVYQAWVTRAISLAGRRLARKTAQGWVPHQAGPSPGYPSKTRKHPERVRESRHHRI